MNNTANHPRVKTLALKIYHWAIRQILAIGEASKTKEFWSDIVVFLCGLLFLYSAGDKLWGYGAFRVQVGKSPILTGRENFIAWFIPVLEIAIAALMIPLWIRHIGLYAFFTLMLTFTGYIILLLRDGSLVPCGCNALFEAMSLEAHIAMNLGFSAIAALALFLSPVPDFTVLEKHPVYRRAIAPVASRIQSMVARFKGKEADGKEKP